MTKKTLLKINWEDIHRYFGKAVRSGILTDLYHPHIIIPTTHKSTLFSELKQCVEEWNALDVKINVNEVGFITYEIAWGDNYQIEVELYPNYSNE